MDIVFSRSLKDAAVASKVCKRWHCYLGPMLKLETAIDIYCKKYGTVDVSKFEIIDAIDVTIAISPILNCRFMVPQSKVITKNHSNGSAFITTFVMIEKKIHTLCKVLFLTNNNNNNRKKMIQSLLSPERHQKKRTYPLFIIDAYGFVSGSSTCVQQQGELPGLLSYIEPESSKLMSLCSPKISLIFAKRRMKKRKPAVTVVLRKQKRHRVLYRDANLMPLEEEEEEEEESSWIQEQDGAMDWMATNVY